MNTLHRSLAIAAVALSTSGAAADPVLQIYCQECRDSTHSVDYGNFAFNQTYGDGSWVLQDELVIVNPQGDWVFVDLSFVLSDNIISNVSEFIGLDLGLPTGNILIETTTENTTYGSYVIDLDMVDTMGPLPVGGNTPPPGNNNPPPGNNNPPTDGGGDSSGGGSTSGGGVGAGPGTGSGGAGDPGGPGGGGGGGGLACTSAGNGEWHCVAN